ncbi:MAG: succinylglutamate-semialdehyde dehydrogenase [Planctomycetota bacterium]|nr:MAG: succinylglutamate-semialdehyde dehydrogenase [Planctomycetota bacterium]
MTDQGSLYINGQWINGNGKSFKSTDPYTEKVLWENQSASVDDVDNAIKAAGSTIWNTFSSEKRIEILKQFVTQLENNKDDFATTISQEMGKPKWESLTEVSAMIGKLNISIEAFNTRCNEVSKPMGKAISITRFKPHGIIAVFGPFNLPGHLPNGHIIPALIAGNTIVFKPSEQTPLVGQKYMELWDKTDIPAGVINMVQGEKETGIAIASHKDLNGLFFTGSYEVGRILHKQFGGYPEKILALEMGGNNPLIIWDVKNLEAAVYLTIQSAFITTGQRCVCARRLLLPDDSFSDKFIKLLIEKTKKIKINHYSEKEEPFIGPLVSKEGAKNIIDQQSELVNNGSVALLPCHQDDKHSAIITPGIIDSTLNHSKKDHEIFGPLLQIFKVKTFEQAIDEANNTNFGLSAGIISDDQNKYDKFRQSSNAGILNWNRQITGASGAAPFGGSGYSGNHRPAAYLAADYCSWPVASIETSEIEIPENTPPGL